MILHSSDFRIKLYIGVYQCIPSTFFRSFKGDIRKQVSRIGRHRKEFLYTIRDSLDSRLNKNCFSGF